MADGAALIPEDAGSVDARVMAPSEMTAGRSIRPRDEPEGERSDKTEDESENGDRDDPGHFVETQPREKKCHRAAQHATGAEIAPPAGSLDEKQHSMGGYAQNECDHNRDLRRDLAGGPRATRLEWQ